MPDRQSRTETSPAGPILRQTYTEELSGNEGKFQHHFLPLSPPVSAGDLSEIRTLERIPYETKSGSVFSISLLGRTHTVDAIAISVPPEAVLHDNSVSIAKAFEHMLTALRLSYDPLADVVRFGDNPTVVRNYTDSEIPEYQLVISQFVRPDHVIDATNLARVFCQTSTAKLAPILSLIAEAQFSPIPPSYRFLSLIRAAELIFDDDHNGLINALESRRGDVVELLRPNQGVYGASVELRNRCAHGKSRGNFLPLTGLAIREPEIQAFIELLRKVLCDSISVRFGVQINYESPKSLG